MSIELNIIEEAEQFVRVNLEPYASKFDIEESFPVDLIKRMAKEGYLGAPLPKKYGGGEMDPLMYGRLTEVFGKTCASARALLTVHTSLVGETLNALGSEKQKSKLLPLICSGERIGAFALSEPETGSNAEKISTTYEKVKDKYIVNGHKKWITFAGLADFFIVVAQNKETKSAFIIERNSPGITLKPIKGLIGNRASHISEIIFNNVEVEPEALLTREGQGFSFVVNAALDFGRYSIAWGGLALAQTSLEAMIKYARERTQFGQKIYQHQLIKGIIADAVTSVHAARHMCIKVGEMRKERHPDSIIETNIAKYYTSKIANQVTSDAVQVHGGNGCTNTYPVERFFREAKILEIIEGTSQIQQIIISSFGLKRYFKV